VVNVEEFCKSPGLSVALATNVVEPLQSVCRVASLVDLQNSSTVTLQVRERERRYQESVTQETSQLVDSSINDLTPHVMLPGVRDKARLCLATALVLLSMEFTMYELEKVSCRLFPDVQHLF